LFMSRPAPTPTTLLGGALIKARGETTGKTLAPRLGVSVATYYRLERGDHEPTFDTALKLARWLGEGWTVERVMDAARERAPATSSGRSDTERRSQTGKSG
jgi:DNA-binding XRE family transcriptional regulator